MIGALRVRPNAELHVGGHTIIPNPFFGGALFPLVVFMLLYALPWIDRRFISRESEHHELLDNPRDNPLRSALIAAGFAAVAIVFAAGSADRLFFQFGFDYEGAIWFFRIAFFVFPAGVFYAVKRICNELRRTRAHPLREWSGEVVRRNEQGGFEALEP